MATNTTQFRLSLQAAGFDPVPALGKDTLLKGWNKPHSNEEVAAWGVLYPNWNNTGIQTAKTPAFDIDIVDPEAANAVEEAFREWFDGRGRLLVRFGRAPKRAIPFKTAHPFRKIRVDFTAPNGAKHHVEVLGDGQQVIIDGMHPDTQQPYRWYGGDRPGDIPRDELPEIDETEARALLSFISDMLVEKFSFQVARGNGGHNEEHDEGHSVDVEAELAAIHYGNIHDTWKRCVGSLLRRGETADNAFAQIQKATEARCQNDPQRQHWGKKLAAIFAWYLEKTPELLTSLSEKQLRAWKARVAAGEHPQLVWRPDFGLHIRTQCEDSKGPEPPTPNGIAARPFQRFDPAKLPPREWLYGKHYQRGIITATVGPGGGGKSSLDLVEMIAVCTGRNLLGEQPRLRCKAWYHNAEDSRDEIYRRIAAVCQHYQIDQSELEGWLFVTSGIEMPIKVAATRSGKVTIDLITTEAIIRTIADNDIGVSSFDPLVAHHSSVENATGDMDQLIREFARIANVTDCAIEIVHHTRKPAPGQEELNVADSRGAGAIINAVRSARVLNPMSKAEGDKAGVDDVDRRLHFRIDTGKANMAPPSAARWHKVVGTDLPNGDNVGVVVPWSYPTAASAELPDHTCVLIQTEVARGDYRANAQSPNWVGHLVARIFRLDLSSKAGTAAAGRYLAALYTKGVIATGTGATAGHKVKTVTIGTWRPA